MDCDENGGRKIGGKIFGKVSQRLDAARRRANGQNVTIGHPKTRPFAIFVDNVSASLWVPADHTALRWAKPPVAGMLRKAPASWNVPWRTNTMATAANRSTLTNQ